jgi:hypothetical protein
MADVVDKHSVQTRIGLILAGDQLEGQKKTRHLQTGKCASRRSRKDQLAYSRIAAYLLEESTEPNMFKN